MCHPMWAHWRHLANMIELVLPSAHTSPQPKLQDDRFRHFCTAHGRETSGTLARPGEHDWTRASFGPPESTTQTANRWVQLFLHSYGRKSLYFTMGDPFPQNCSLSCGGDLDPIKFIIPWASVQAHNPNSILIGSAVFAQMTAECPYTLQWDAPFPPQNCRFQWGTWTHI